MFKLSIVWGATASEEARVSGVCVCNISEASVSGVCVYNISIST